MPHLEKKMANVCVVCKEEKNSAGWSNFMEFVCHECGGRLQRCEACNFPVKITSCEESVLCTVCKDPVCTGCGKTIPHEGKGCPINPKTGLCFSCGSLIEAKRYAILRVNKARSIYYQACAAFTEMFIEEIDSRYR